MPVALADTQVTDGRMVIMVDELRHCLVREDQNGKTTTVGRKGQLPGEFHYPTSVMLVEDLLYVVDSWNHRIQVFDRTSLEFRFQFGGLGSGPGQFFCPASIAIVDRWLVILDTNNNRLCFHNRDGRVQFASALFNCRFPRRMRVVEGLIELQHEDGEWERLEFV